MADKSPADAWTTMAAAAVDATLSPYGAGMRDFPVAAFSNPYVLGFVNAVLLCVLDRCIGDDGPFEFREQLLIRSQKLLDPRLARSLVDLSPGLFAFSDEDYVLGIAHGELFAEVVNGNPPFHEPEILQSARELVGTAGQLGVTSGANIAGAIVVLTLYRRVGEIEKSSPASMLTDVERKRAMVLGIQDAEFGAALNIKRRKARMARDQPPAHTGIFLPSVLLMLGLIFVAGLLLQRVS